MAPIFGAIFLWLNGLSFVAVQLLRHFRTATVCRLNTWRIEFQNAGAALVETESARRGEQ
jgi:hypothetical protein